MNCDDLKDRNEFLLDKISKKLKIKILDMEELFSFNSVFTSFEEERVRLRIIGVRQTDNDDVLDNMKKKKKRITLALIGKKFLKENKTEIEIVKLQAELFCKLWQQAKNVNIIKEQEKLIENKISKLEEKTGVRYL